MDKPCNRGTTRPRKRGQRWCVACRAEYDRERKAARRQHRDTIRAYFTSLRSQSAPQQPQVGPAAASDASTADAEADDRDRYVKHVLAEQAEARRLQAESEARIKPIRSIYVPPSREQYDPFWS